MEHPSFSPGSLRFFKRVSRCNSASASARMRTAGLEVTFTINAFEANKCLADRAAVQVARVHAAESWKTLKLPRGGLISQPGPRVCRAFSPTAISGRHSGGPRFDPCDPRATSAPWAMRDSQNTRIYRLTPHATAQNQRPRGGRRVFQPGKPTTTSTASRFAKIQSRPDDRFKTSAARSLNTVWPLSKLVKPRVL